MKTSALIAAAAVLTAAQEPFKVGDIVVWKDSTMANKAIPKVGQPAVVTRVIADPIVNTTEEAHGTAYYGERNDIALAVFCHTTNGGDVGLLEFVHDSRRFRHAMPEEITAWDDKQDAAN